MSLNVGELVAFLDLDDQGFEQGLGRSEGGMGRLLGVGRAAALGIGAAMVAGAGYSLAAFTDFDTGMREVFTLLPGMSQQAMDDMTGQVQDFSREFGVLPDQVIPALYQALSAGVPQGNVFEFLETAQMAARAGVTDLETAVDGLTSTVNAYGAENLSATQASDLMFTAVRMGKTTFEELSASLFQVNPVAASLGVSFDQVTAALATMTSQGVPTSVATTQLRQMLVELSDSGGELGQTFADLSGQSFTDFVASGGNVQGALQLLEQHAADSGVGLGELFGSVEAGQAALALSGQNASTFSSNLAEMGGAAGATEAAYAGMADGMQFQLDRLKAAAQVFAIEVGGRLAEVAAPALELAADVMNAFGEGGIRGALDELRSAFSEMPGWMQVVLGAAGLGGLAAIAVVVVGALSFLISIPVLVAAAIGALAAAVVWAYNNFEGFRNVVDAVVSWMVGTAWPLIQQFARWIADQFANLVGWVAQHWGAISEAVGHYVNLLQAYVGAVLAWLSTAWEVWGEEVLAIVVAAWDFIRGTVENAVSMIASIIELVLAVINGDWGAAWEAIKSILQTVWDQMGNIISFAWELIKNIVTGALGALRELWSMAWQAMLAQLSMAWEAIKAGVALGIDLLVAWVTSLPGRVNSALAGLPGLMLSAGRFAMQALWNGLQAVWGGVTGWLGGLGGRIVSAIGSLARTLYNAGRAVIEGLLDGMRAAWDAAASWLSDRAGAIASLKGPIDYDRTILRPAGRAIMEGLEGGMREGWVPVAGFLGDITSYIGDSAAPSLRSGPGTLPGASASGLDALDYDRLGQAIAAAMERNPQEVRATFEVDGRKLADAVARPAIDQWSARS